MGVSQFYFFGVIGKGSGVFPQLRTSPQNPFATKNGASQEM